MRGITSLTRNLLTGLYLLSALLFLLFYPQTATSEQPNEPIVAYLSLPRSQIFTLVTPTSINNHRFNISDQLVSLYRLPHKQLLMAHSNTAFTGLDTARLGDPIFLADRLYHITHIKQLPIAEIDMNDITADSASDSLLLMTCAGPGGSSERLIITAQ